jgi:hypothetical protein
MVQRSRVSRSTVLTKYTGFYTLVVSSGVFSSRRSGASLSKSGSVGEVAAGSS